jgi:hypothetical protein
MEAQSLLLKESKEVVIKVNIDKSILNCFNVTKNIKTG